MKKIFILLFLFSTLLHINIKAQQPLKIRVDNLKAEVDSLSHELEYLKLTFEIYTLNNDIKLLTSQIEKQIIDIRFSFNSGKLEREMYVPYELVYDRYKEDLANTKNLIETKQVFFVSKLFTTSCTVSEIDILKQSFSMTDGLYKQAELSLELLRTALDIYRDNM